VACTQVDSLAAVSPAVADFVAEAAVVGTGKICFASSSREN
jgi:hypothetical protein